MVESLNFEYDVFISYTHRDNQSPNPGEEGWISRFHDFFNIRLGELLGREPKIWRDSKLQGNDEFSDEIMDKLRKAKVLLTVISPSYIHSKWCLEELRSFLEAAQSNVGICVGNKSRIFKIIKTNVPYDQHPVEIRGLNGYKFFELGENNRQHEFHPEKDSLYHQKFRDRLEEVASDICQLINELDRPVSPSISHQPKQIKILSIMASPEAERHDYYLEYEKEQDTMLDVFNELDQERVFLDMPDPVRSTLEEIEGYLNDGHHDVLHISAHGGKNQKGEGVLFLEDAHGMVKQVTGAKLAKVLNPCPKLVILSACHSASPEPELIPAAQALFAEAEQVKAVIGMQKAVSQLAAIDFNTAFFKALCEGKKVEEAFEKGKKNIKKREAQRREDMRDWPFQNEHQIPHLLLRDKKLSMTTFSDERITAPERPESQDFIGARYLERGFIGRRGILRKIYKEVEDCKGAVVLKGPGGIGKSTLTTRAAANLRRKGYDFIVLQGETTVERILEKIAKEAAASGVKEIEEVYRGNFEEKEKLAWFVKHYLKKHRVVLIFDNFEENQDAEQGGEFLHQGLKKFLWFFRDLLKHKHSILFFSTRYGMPGFDCMEIKEFSQVEFRKMQLNRRVLKRLDRQSVEKIHEEIGGNPRALDLLDRISWKEFGEQEFNWEELKDLIPGLRERLIENQSREDDFTPLFLERLLSYLDNSQCGLLNAAAVYRIPVKKEAISVHNASVKREVRAKLVDLSLLEYLKNHDLYYVHRLTAYYLLEKMHKNTCCRYHRRAAEYFEGIRDEEGKKYFDNDREARWHYLQAGEWNRMANVTFALEYYLKLHGFPQQSLELLKEIEEKDLNEENRSIVYHKMGELYHGFCDYDTALVYYQKSMDIKVKIEDFKGVSDILVCIGAISQAKGDYNEALTRYQKAKDTSEKIGDSEGISYILNNIGGIYQEKGKYDEALTQYQRSMEIREKINDKKGVSENLHNIGTLYQVKGDYDAALIQYIKSMEIKVDIGDKKGVSDNLLGIGAIYQYKGDYDAALTHYQKSKEMKEEIRDILGVALCKFNIGDLFSEQKKFEQALKLFCQAFAVFAKVGSPAANEAKKSIFKIKKELPEERFEEILGEFHVTPGMVE